MLIKKLLDPKIDYVFKRIFGHKGNEEITTNLISSIINKKVENINLDCNPILEKDLFDDKIGILDIKAKIDSNINCNVEMQVANQKDIEKRILYYWSKMYSSSIKSGEKYSSLEKTIVILITDYNLSSLKSIEKYITKWNLREEDYSNCILTDTIEFYILELTKFKEYKEKSSNKDLNLWVNLIKNLEVTDMSKEEASEETKRAIEKAKQVLEEISEDEHERYLAELRQKHIMDSKAIEEYGYDRGLEQGRKEKIAIIKNLLKQNVNINIIIKATGLTKEEIENLL